MTKQMLIQSIITTLEADLALFVSAAKTAHEAATHKECLPDNKYDTTALEASYLAQGQANRAQEIRACLENYRGLTLKTFDNETPIRLTALITVEDTDGGIRRLFLGPQAGGLKVSDEDGEIVVITPGSPLGRALIGCMAGDEVTVGEGATAVAFTVISVD
jgi:transcription elongation GreA/GreB family factor